MDNPRIIIFDGVCNFCNNSVNFIIKRDHNNSFLFSPMQSQFAQDTISKFGVEGGDLDTFILIKNGECYVRTDAALEIAKDLSGHWYLFNIFILLPRPIRDFFYRVFAKNRYRLFGRSDTCMVPSQEVADKFLD
jgi:predicted DCC family thiol-disulfide oxidoreductase YuxK